MKNVTIDFRKGSRDYYLTAKIKFADGHEKNLAKEDFYLSGNSYIDSPESNSLPLGAAIEKQITLSLVNDDDRFSAYDFLYATIMLYCNLAYEDKIESLQMGTYTVRSPEAYGTIVEVTAVDDAYKGDKSYSTNLTFPMSAGEALRDSCRTCNVYLLTTNFKNDDYIIKKIPEGITHRKFWGLCAMLAGGNARFDGYNRLSIVPYDFSLFENDEGLDGGEFDHDPYSTGVTADGGSFSPWNIADALDGGTFAFLDGAAADGGAFSQKIYETGDTADGGGFSPWNTGYVYDGGGFTDDDGLHYLHRCTNLTVDTDDVVITGIEAEVDGEKYIFGEEGYSLKVDNQIMTDNVTDALQRIGNLIVGIRFRPFSMDHISIPYAEFGDPCYIIDRKQNVYQSIITDVSIAFGGYTTIKCSADSALRNSSDYYTKITEAIVTARRNTESQITEYDKAVQMLTNLITQSFGVFKTEEVLDDGSTIYYLHNKPILEESQTIWKMTADAFAVSTDGGKTWNAGMDSSGNAVVNVLSAIGINFDWAKGGTLTLGGQNNTNGKMIILDANGKQIGKWDNNGINATSGKFSGTLESAGGVFSGITQILSTKKTGDNPFRIRARDTYTASSGNESTFYVYFCAGTDGFLVARNRPGNRQFIRMMVGADDGIPILSGGTFSGFSEDDYTMSGESEKLKIHSDGEIKSAWTYENTTESGANVHISSSGIVYHSASSSRRYKVDETTNLGDMSPEKLYDLPVKVFKYKDGYLTNGDRGIGKNILGFIAEDVEEIYPCAVEYNDNDLPESWNSRIMIPALLKLIQDQNERLKMLENIIGEIKDGYTS